MQTHQRKSSIASWLAGAALLIFAALALPGTQAPTRAQEAPKSDDQKTLLLTPDELAIWTDYLHGDIKAAYDKTSALLASPKKLNENELRVAVSLRRKLSIELGSCSQHTNDLRSLVSGTPAGLGQDRVRFELTQALRGIGRNEEADSEAAKLGYITNWWVCGPFSNERGEGFEGSLGEVDARIPDIAAKYVGKEAQECRFVKVPSILTDGVIDIGSLLRPSNEAAAVLIAAIKPSAAMKRFHLSAASDGPLELRVIVGPDPADKENASFEWRKTVFTSNNERELGFDQDFAIPEIPIESTGRWTVLILKVGHSDGPWRVRVRARGADCVAEFAHAETLDSLRQAIESMAAPNRREMNGGGGDDIPRPSPNQRELLIGCLQYWLMPWDDRNSSALSKGLQEINESFEKRAKLPQYAAVDSKPERALLTYLLAEASKSSSRVASGKEENKRRELLEQVLKLDPKAARAALELAKYYSGTFRNPTEADRYAKMAVSLAPKWVEARVFAARVATMKGLEGEVERELNALLKEYPDHPSVLRFAGYYRGVRGDYKGSDELFKRCLYKGDFTDEYCRERLFTRAVERNDTDAAIQYANETRQLNPFDLASSEGLIQLFLATGYLERAMAECERALNICPREDKFLARKGEIYMRMAAREPAKAADFKAKALAAYRESLKCNPNNEDLARYFEFLADEKPVWEVKLQENIASRIEAALKLPVDGNDPYRVVYRDEITVVNDDGTKSIYFQYAYRICNDDGREVLQELGAPAYSDQVGRCVGARVYRRDGGTEEGRRVESQAMLPPLDVGDIVAVRYRVSDTAQSFFGDFFGASEALGDFVPVDEVRLVYVLPKSRKFFEYVQHGAAPAVKREEGDKSIWTYTAKNLARVPREGMQLPLEQMVPTVQVSTYENWKEFGRWYFNLIKKQLEPTPEMKAKVALLIEGKTSERDKARAVYNWVVTNIRYNADWHFGVHGYKPFSAGAIFERCIGDCKDKAIVICTMLGIAGVTAYPVLIRLADSSEPRGREDITLPMPHHFNHAIAYIEYADGKGQFVDGTATFNGFEELPGSDAGANVVIVRPEGGVQTQVPIPKAAENSTRENVALEFLGNGKLKLTIKLTAKGDRASYLRAIYLQSGTRATQLESQWTRHKAGAKVTKVEANDLANIDLPPEIKYEVELPDAYSTDAQGNIELAVALNPLLFGKGLAAATTRRTDIAQGAPHQWQSVVRFKPPAGMTLEKFPANYLDDAFGSNYWVSVEQIDREYCISRTYSSGGGVIEAKDYGRLREMMLAYDRAEAIKLKLVKEK